jgi:hypothetical protein
MSKELRPIDSTQYIYISIYIWGVPRVISITAVDDNETKLNVQMFMLSIVMTFIEGNPVQPFNPFGENRR